MHGLAQQIDEIGFEPLYDSSFMDATSPHAHQEILSKIESSDLMLVLLTESALQSLEVRDEMAVARTWNIPFFVIHDESASRDLLPWFLSQAEIAVRYRSSDRADWRLDLESRVQAKLPNVLERWVGLWPTLRAIRMGLQSARAEVTTRKEVASFRLQVVKEVIEQAKLEVSNLLSDEYNQDLSVERTFIVRAEPIFRSAKHVYATSIDSLSQFWTAAEQRGTAQRYTAAQPQTTVRIFVFSSPKTAHQYRNILSAHDARYGERGAVLLCSVDRYHKMMRSMLRESFSDHQIRKKFREHDFGVLLFSELDGTEMYEATLSKTTLSLRRANDVELWSGIRDFFERAKSDASFREASGLMRWERKFMRSDAWKRALKQIFDRDPSTPQAGNQDVFHFVFFSDTVDENGLKREITKQVKTLADLETKDGTHKLIKEYWFGTRSEALRTMKVRDAKYGGEIRTTSEMDRYPFVLIMRLENVDTLKEYYEDPSHADVRENIYRVFDDRYNDMFEIFANGSLEERHKDSLYATLESSVGAYMLRVDYLEHDDIDWIVEHLMPYEFELPTPR